MFAESKHHRPDSQVMIYACYWKTSIPAQKFKIWSNRKILFDILWSANQTGENKWLNKTSSF
jgi:hypothetical protein